MATVTQLLDRGSQVTGLRATAGSTERTLALQALNNAYQRAVLDAEASPAYATYNFTSNADTYALATVLGSSSFTRLLHVGLNSSGGIMNLDQVSMQELMDYRSTEDTQGLPCLYATIGSSDIAFYPNPSSGDQLRVWYLRPAPELVESGATGTQETTPSKVPQVFHWDLLLAGMVLEMLDKDQRKDDVQFWGTRYERALARFIEHIGQMGGEANRAYIAVGSRRPYLRDERSRR